MRMSYSCPHCGAVLNPDVSIMLIGTHAGRSIMIGFHPVPGNYRISLPPGVEIDAGSNWDFTCPLCRESLVSEVSDQLCCLDMVMGEDHHRVYFSRVAGEHATFVISAEGIERFGEHAERHSLEILEFV